MADGSTTVMDDLLSRYGEQHRHYHDTSHLRRVLDALDRLGTDGVPAEVRLAAWFHDAVYDPRRHDNEDASAALVAASAPVLGLSADRTRRISAMVLATKGFDGEFDLDTRLLLDADLSPLGADAAVYRSDVAALRAEYRHLSDEEYLARRRRVLAGFLRRRWLFRTDAGRRLLEGPARRNLRAELDERGRG